MLRIHFGTTAPVCLPGKRQTGVRYATGVSNIDNAEENGNFTNGPFDYPPILRTLGRLPSLIPGINSIELSV